MTNPTERRHLLTWSDPAISASALGAMSGLDYVRSLRDTEGPLPPMYSLCNFRFLEADPGHVVFLVTPAEYHCNPVGIVHGGLACTALDTATALTILTLLPAGADLMSLEVKVNFVRAITLETGDMRCEGRVIHAGRRVATAEGRITDGKGVLHAHAVSTCLISQ